MPDERNTDLPGSDDPVDPTRVDQPVDTSHAQGAAPAAGMGQPDRRFEPLTPEPPRGRRDDDRNRAQWLWALLAAVLIGIVLYAVLSLGDDDGDAMGATGTAPGLSEDDGTELLGEQGHHIEPTGIFSA